MAFLFDHDHDPERTPERVELAAQLYVLPQYVDTRTLLPWIDAVSEQSAFRHMMVPGGQTMKVALSNCGAMGWVSDSLAYRYTALNPNTQAPWPAMPRAFAELARRAAGACEFQNFEPDACLINRYVAGAGMGLHQDRQERDFSQPIVSVSIGASCRFIVGGLQRKDPTRSVLLHDGDVMVWGGASRLVFHGVRPLPVGSPVRYNLTFRQSR